MRGNQRRQQRIVVADRWSTVIVVIVIGEVAGHAIPQ
jgi:hypothetical protein